MNELIAKLAEQAAQESAIIENEINLEVIVDDVMSQIPGNFIQRFAELLVKECATLVEGFEITQEVALDEYVDFEAGAVLKEHFGVEE